MHMAHQKDGSSTECTTCPKCGFHQREQSECLKCGIVFAKYLAGQSAAEPVSEPASTGHVSRAGFWKSRAGNLPILFLMTFFFFYMVIKRSSWCFLDYVNLPFHEFGHLLFGPFGYTLQFLGGTISQLMWPLILTGYFLMKREHLSASFCLFWFGENFLNISKYVADARSMSLPLVGGGIHDWNVLLGTWNALQHDHTIAKVLFSVGVIVMAGSMGWALLTNPQKNCPMTKVRG